MSTAYDADATESWRRTGHDAPAPSDRPDPSEPGGVVWTDAVVAVVAAVALAAVWLGAGDTAPRRLLAGAGLVVLGTVVALGVDRFAIHRAGHGVGEPRPPVPVVALSGLVLLLVVAGVVRSASTWQGAVPRHTGPYVGWVVVTDDPVRSFGAVRVVLEIEGERFRADARGALGRRVEGLQAGESVLIRGVRHEPSDGQRRRLQLRHVVGTVDLGWVADAAVGSPAVRAANRVRDALRRSAEAVMAPDDAGLFTGLVIGDDARQAPEMIDRFRRSGLSHLTAVSGQNVAYVLALAGVLLRRLRAWPRLVLTVALIAWFVILTRFEPSVLRAGTMAALAAIAFAVGQERSPFRLLCLAMVVLVLVDPMLVWSVGFWLSSGATVGVTVVAPWIARRCRGPDWLVPALAVSVGAQIGVAVPSLLVFHRLPVGGVVANLLAVPVAGFVMLYGIPAGLVAAAVPHGLAVLVLGPASLGTRWVATVAALAARFEPTGAAAVVVWLVQGAALAVALRRGRAADLR